MEKEVCCEECGAYFMLLPAEIAAKEIQGTCPECGYEDAHIVTGDA